MTLSLCSVKLINIIYSSTLSVFSEIFLAVNQRELCPAPVIPGSGDEFIKLYINAGGESAAH